MGAAQGTIGEDMYLSGEHNFWGLPFFLSYSFFHDFTLKSIFKLILKATLK